MDDRHPSRLAPRHVFLRRLRRTAILAGLLISGSLLLGILGYHFLGGLPWLDSLLNASMILAGMGPVNPIPTSSGKIFASAYALYSGVALLGGVAVLIAPVVHRILHRYHLELDREDQGDGDGGTMRRERR